MPKGINAQTGVGNLYKHGYADKPWSKLYRTWVQMRGRCNNVKNQDYPYYGGRGITVCSRWDDYENFAADMGEPPTPQHTLDRIHGDDNYYPANCRWATRREQSNNRAYCRMKDDVRAEIKRLYGTGAYTQKQLAEQYGVSQVRISQVVRHV